MNPNESEFEQQLQSLRPRPASEALEQKIAASLGHREIAVSGRAPAGAILRGTRPARTHLPGWLQGLGWAFAGAVVAVGVITIAERIHSSKPLASTDAAPAAAASAEAFEHTESTEELVTAEDEGLVVAN